MSSTRLPRHALNDEEWNLIADLFPVGHFKTGRRPRDRQQLMHDLLGAAYGKPLAGYSHGVWALVHGLEFLRPVDRGRDLLHPGTASRELPEVVAALTELGNDAAAVRGVATVRRYHADSAMFYESPGAWTVTVTK